MSDILTEEPENLVDDEKEFEGEFSGVDGDLIRGNIDTIILKTLIQSDRYGYDIIKEIEQKSGGAYQIKQPTLYSCLRRLEEQGFTRSYWGAKSLGGRKKYYTLTDMGRDVFARNKNEWLYSRGIIDKLVADGQPAGFATAKKSAAAVAADSGTFFNPTEVLAAETLTESGADFSAAQNSCQLPIEQAPDDNSVLSQLVENNNSGSGLDKIFNEETANPAQQEEQNPEYYLKNDTAELSKEAQRVVDDEINQMFDSVYSGKKSYVDDIEHKVYQPSAPVYDRSQSGNFIDDEEIPFENLRFDAENNAQTAEAVTPCETQNITTTTNETNQSEYTQHTTYISNTYYNTYTSGQAADGATAVNTAAEPSPKNQSEADSGVSYRVHPNAEHQSNSSFAGQAGSGAIELPPQESSQPAVSCHSSASLLSQQSTRYSGLSSLGANTELSDGEIIKRDYRAALERLVTNNIRSAPITLVVQNQQEAKLEKVQENMVLTGDSMIIRRHDDSLKEYNEQNYFYKNQLRLHHHGMMFIIMLAQIAVMLIVHRLLYPVGARFETLDIWLYICSVVISFAAYPLIAVILAFNDYHARKSQNFDFNTSLLFRLIVVALLWGIIFVANIGLGILRNDFTRHLTTLVLPAILVLNIFISLFLYKGFLSSGKFNVKN